MPSRIFPKLEIGRFIEPQIKDVNGVMSVFDKKAP